MMQKQGSATARPLYVWKKSLERTLKLLLAVREALKLMYILFPEGPQDVGTAGEIRAGSMA